MEEKRVKIIYDGKCFQVFDYNGNRVSYVVDYQLEYQELNNEVLKNIKVPKLANVSIVCWDFEKNGMFNDLRTEYISTKEELKEFIYDNL